MSPTCTKVDAYQDSVAEFAKQIMAHLRKLLHETCPGIVEEIKWGIPHFDYKGEMMCMFAAYSKHCSFSFWKEELMSDPRFRDNPGKKAPKRFLGKLNSLSDLPPDKELIAFIKEAMRLNEQKIKLSPKPSEKRKEVAMPGFFAEALAGNPAAKAIFESKSDSFRKEYIVWLADAKTDVTRQKRVEESLEWISEGKGRFWKYQKSR